MRRLLAGLALSFAVASCVIIVKPGGDQPVPVPIPLTCNPASEAPKAHVYFATRIERSTVNLADRYSTVMQDVALGLAAAGVEVTTGVLVRQDEREIQQPMLAAWGCNLDSPERLLPADVIRWYATQTEPEDAELRCAVDPLVSLGANLPDTVTQYPPGVPGTNGLSVFGAAPDLVLVVHLDHLGRRIGFEEPACDDARRALQSDWLAYAGPDVPRDRVLHWFLSTEEQLSRDAFVAGCKMVDGFPSSVLDSLEESRTAFYGPMDELVRSSGGSTAGLSMCRLLVETEEKKFLKQEIEHVAGMLGLTVDEERLKSVLAGGLPELAGEEVPPEGDLAIPGR